MARPLLEVSHLSRSFGQHRAVKDVSFTIHEGETYGLLGPNGAGKTTTISMVSGVLRRDAGEVRLDGVPVSTKDTRGRGAIGLVPQDLAIYPDLTARENLRFFGRLYGMAGAALGRRVDEVLELVGLTDRAGSLARTYSGGMKRRLNIAVGLLHRPKLLILDEPTVGVDPQSRNAILESVELLAGEGVAVLYTTHYMEEAERLCDRVGIIDEGEVKAEGTRRELVDLVGGEDVVRLEATGELGPAATALEGLDGVRRVDVQAGTLQVVTTGAARLLPAIVERVAAAGGGVARVEVSEPDLESVFLHLTGKALRD
ncbi:MAG TPA: ABC transporter ATP-binding protein [Trueperaceae bacterium]|nr:ABC transporter ATP-binding protein [Trueperaceae bacterium]